MWLKDRALRPGKKMKMMYKKYDQQYETNKIPGAQI
jgi:hypothetical protein